MSVPTSPGTGHTHQQASSASSSTAAGGGENNGGLVYRSHVVHRCIRKGSSLSADAFATLCMVELGSAAADSRRLLHQLLAAWMVGDAVLDSLLKLRVIASSGARASSTTLVAWNKLMGDQVSGWVGDRNFRQWIFGQ